MKVQLSRHSSSFVLITNGNPEFNLSLHLISSLAELSFSTSYHLADIASLTMAQGFMETLARVGGL